MAGVHRGLAPGSLRTASPLSPSPATAWGRGGGWRGQGPGSGRSEGRSTL